MHPHWGKDWGDATSDSTQHRLLGILVTKSTVGANRVENTQNHHHHHNGFASFYDKGFEPIPRVQQYTLHIGHMVTGQLHNERCCSAPEQGVLHNQAGKDGYQYTHQIEAKHHVLTSTREEDHSKQRINRQSRTTGHKRIHHDGELTVTLLIQCPGCHNRWYIAAKTDQYWQKGLARQTKRPHPSIHHERRPGHIARIFQQRQEQEQTTNHRNEGSHRLDTTANTIGHYGG